MVFYKLWKVFSAKTKGHLVVMAKDHFSMAPEVYVAQRANWLVHSPLCHSKAISHPETPYSQIVFGHEVCCFYATGLGQTTAQFKKHGPQAVVVSFGHKWYGGNVFWELEKLGSSTPELGPIVFFKDWTKTSSLGHTYTNYLDGTLSPGIWIMDFCCNQFRF